MSSRRRVNSTVMPLVPNELLIDQVLKAIGLISAVGAFVAGLLQYRRAQKWKRAEWVAQEMKRLFDDPMVQNALLMIDWGTGRRIRLYPEAPSITDQYVPLKDEDIARALRLPNPDGFTDEEAAIRAAFDRFLDGLERFHAYVETGLVTIEDISPYLRYWLYHMCVRPTDKTETRLVQLRIYMKEYGFDGGYKLFQKIDAA